VFVRVTGPLLKVLNELIDGRERYGLDLMRSTNLKSGTLYPILDRLEEQGLVSSRWERRDPRELHRPRRRFYELTGLGAREAHRILVEHGVNIASASLI
jgi:PadR family transcriptional regulator PadR